MRQLTCEMCGSTELLKQDGVFVCQTCGCKYSVEEAKKMMVEGTVEIKGTVRVDHSPEVVNRLKNADSNYASSHYKEAFDLYNQVLNIEPDNAHAIMYRGLSSAWQGGAQDKRLDELFDAVKQSFSLLHDKIGETSEFFSFCTDALSQALLLQNGCYRGTVNYYEAQLKTYARTIGDGISNGIYNAKVFQVRNNDIISTICAVFCDIGDYVMGLIADFSEADNEFYENLRLCYKNASTIRSQLKIEDDSNLHAAIRKIDDIKRKIATEKAQKKEAERKARFDAYWADHIDEKTSLEKEWESLDEQISVINKTIENVEGKDEIEKQRSEKNKLQNEFDSLGMFKMKEKKALQAKIDTANTELRAMEKERQNKQEELRKNIAPLRKRIDEIKKELTMDR